MAAAAAPVASSGQGDSLPSPLSSLNSDTVTALARFEFEPNRGNDGTKIMMVEWQDDSPTGSSHTNGAWQISWQGKKTTFAAADNPSDSTNRLYFLLPPGQPIPPTVTIAYEEPGSSAKTLEKTVNPLPAIFTPELGATAKAAGKKGVLHTIWAKKRLQVLEKEIQNEEVLNLEGIALEMARAEKAWIEQNFGVTHREKPPNLDLGGAQKMNGPPSLQSPRSPGGRRLTDRLKGLSLVTGNDSTGVNTPTREINPLSPEAGDMAYSSFSAIRGDRPQLPTVGNAGPAQTKRMAPIAPPAEVTEQQAESAAASLAAIAKGDNKPSVQEAPSKDGEDLFAVAMSPRSPDEPKSPFSIQTADSAGSFSKIKGLQTQRTF